VAAGETDASGVAHRAVHAVSADDVPGVNLPELTSGPGDADRGAVGVSPDVGDGVPAVHLPAQFDKPAGQERLGTRLRQHQRVRVRRRESREVHPRQHPRPRPDGEHRHHAPLSEQARRHVQRLEDLQRPGVQHGRPRGVRTLGRGVNNQHVDAGLAQRAAQRQPGRASADHHDLDLLLHQNLPCQHALAYRR